jgi:hypothetical protein
MRRLATLGWAAPARQRLTAETIESSDQCTKKTTSQAVNDAGRCSPDWGILGNANVQTTRIPVRTTSPFASLRADARNVFVKRKSRYGKRTISAIATRPIARSGMLPE